MSKVEDRATTVGAEAPPAASGMGEDPNPVPPPLSDAKTFLSLAQSTARIGLWSWDTQADTVWHSDELYRLHGLRRGALGNRLEDYIAFVHPDDRQRITEGAWAAAAGETVPVEYRFVHPEGGIRHLLGHSSLVRDGSGDTHQLVGTVQDITEIVRARQSVSETVQRLSSYFDETPTPAYLWRREGDDLLLRRLNKAAAAAWGERASEVAGESASVILRDRPDLVADMHRCLEEQSSFSREIDYVSPDRGERRLVVTYVPVARDSVVVHSQDITELLEAHQGEARATARLAKYFERVPTPAYLWRSIDGDLVLEGANRAAIELTDGLVTDFVGTTAREMYVERPDILDDLRRALTGKTFTRDLRYDLRATGRSMDLVVTYVHIPPDTVVVHTADVTERRRMEAALRDREAEMATLMEGNPDGICLVVDGLIRRCNSSFADMMGYGPQELVGRAPLELMVEEDRERARSQARTIIEGRASAPSEYTVIRADGRPLQVEIYGAAFDFRGEPALIGTVRDIEQRKGSERELAESRDALRALTQNLEHVREQERVQVARDLHDELGSLLTALKIDLADIRSTRTEAEVIDAMSRLVDQAIEIGRRVTARMRPGILDDLGLAAAAQWLGEDLTKRTGIRCEVAFPDGEPELPEGIATAMFRILQEALTNVIRHAEADHVRVTLDADDSSVSLAVSDDGRGFDADRPTRAGFGLLGMRERVRALDGTVEVTSAPGAGTMIRVRLPLAGGS